MKEIKIGEKYHLIKLEEASRYEKPLIDEDMREFFGKDRAVEVIKFGVSVENRIQVKFPDGQYWFVRKEWLTPISNQLGNENNSGGRAIKSKIRYIRGRE